MKLFQCPNCGEIVYFESVSCESCGCALAYDPANRSFARAAADDPPGPGADDPPGPGADDRPGPGRSLRLCDNAGFGVCNWSAQADAAGGLCVACRHNLVIPDLSVDGNQARWKLLEMAKHHLIYSLSRLHLPLADRASDSRHGLGFNFLSDPPDAAAPKVLTGHDLGIITINIAEADDAVREARRTAMGEPYRTLLGHFRHEIGHHYWDLLVDRDDVRDRFRATFGDESRDYGEALRAYYANGAPAGWPGAFISTYASSHPWEDFAETWAHYLHMIDTLEMAQAYGMRVDPPITRDASHSADVAFDPYQARSIEILVSSWIPFTVAINSVNRCMGQPDLYPFILNDAVIAKLGFIHDLIHAGHSA